MIDIDEFMKSLKIRITGLEDNILEQVTTAIEENMSDEPNVKLKCEWITCKFNSEKGNKGEGQLGDCQYIGTIALKTPVFEVDPENECASLVDETMACTIYEPDEKLHPSVKTSFHFVYPD